MLDLLKRAAEKRSFTLISLLCIAAEIVCLVVLIFHFGYLAENEWLDLGDAVLVTVFRLIGVAIPVLLVLSVWQRGGAWESRLFVAALGVRALIAAFSAALPGAASGSAFGGADPATVGGVLLAVIDILIIVDTLQKNKWGKIPFILASAVLILHGLALLSDINAWISFGPLFAVDVFAAACRLLVSFAVVVLLSRCFKLPKAEGGTDDISDVREVTEDRLASLKARFERGEISEDEYKSERESVLNAFRTGEIK